VSNNTEKECYTFNPLCLDMYLKKAKNSVPTSQQTLKRPTGYCCWGKYSENHIENENNL
jgi:hypothetical protein